MDDVPTHMSFSVITGEDGSPCMEVKCFRVMLESMLKTGGFTSFQGADAIFQVASLPPELQKLFQEYEQRATVEDPVTGNLLDGVTSSLRLPESPPPFLTQRLPVEAESLTEDGEVVGEPIMQTEVKRVQSRPQLVQPWLLADPGHMSEPVRKHSGPEREQTVSRDSSGPHSQRETSKNHILATLNQVHEVGQERGTSEQQLQPLLQLLQHVGDGASRTVAASPHKGQSGSRAPPREVGQSTGSDRRTPHPSQPVQNSGSPQQLEGLQQLSFLFLSPFQPQTDRTVAPDRHPVNTLARMPLQASPMQRATSSARRREHVRRRRGVLAPVIQLNYTPREPERTRGKDTVITQEMTHRPETVTRLTRTAVSVPPPPQSVRRTAERTPELLSPRQQRPLVTQLEVPVLSTTVKMVPLVTTGSIQFVTSPTYAKKVRRKRLKGRPGDFPQFLADEQADLTATTRELVANPKDPHNFGPPKPETIRHSDPLVEHFSYSDYRGSQPHHAPYRPQKSPSGHRPPRRTQGYSDGGNRPESGGKHAQQGGEGYKHPGVYSRPPPPITKAEVFPYRPPHTENYVTHFYTKSETFYVEDNGRDYVRHDEPYRQNSGRNTHRGSRPVSGKDYKADYSSGVRGKKNQDWSPRPPPSVSDLFSEGFDVRDQIGDFLEENDPFDNVPVSKDEDIELDEPSRDELSEGAVLGVRGDHGDRSHYGGSRHGPAGESGRTTHTRSGYSDLRHHSISHLPSRVYLEHRHVFPGGSSQVVRRRRQRPHHHRLRRQRRDTDSAVAGSHVMNRSDSFQHRDSAGATELKGIFDSIDYLPDIPDPEILEFEYKETVKPQKPEVAYEEQVSYQEYDRPDEYEDYTGGGPLEVGGHPRPGAGHDIYGFGGHGEGGGYGGYPPGSAYGGYPHTGPYARPRPSDYSYPMTQYHVSIQSSYGEYGEPYQGYPPPQYGKPSAHYGYEPPKPSYTTPTKDSEQFYGLTPKQPSYSSPHQQHAPRKPDYRHPQENYGTPQPSEPPRKSNQGRPMREYQQPPKVKPPSRPSCDAHKACTHPKTSYGLPQKEHFGSSEASHEAHGTDYRNPPNPAYGHPKKEFYEPPKPSKDSEHKGYGTPKPFYAAPQQGYDLASISGSSHDFHQHGTAGHHPSGSYGPPKSSYGPPEVDHEPSYQPPPGYGPLKASYSPAHKSHGYIPPTHVLGKPYKPYRPPQKPSNHRLYSHNGYGYGRTYHPYKPPEPLPKPGGSHRPYPNQHPYKPPPLRYLHGRSGWEAADERSNEIHT